MKLLKLLTQIAIISMPMAGSAERLLVDIDLIWKPTQELHDQSFHHFKDDSSLKVEIQDGRTVKPATRIGLNQEESNTFLPVETENDVANFVRTSLISTLKNFEFRITDHKPELTLVGEIKEFFVTETNEYRGKININYKLKRGNKVIWQKEIAGENISSGRSYKLNNYMENLSNCLLDSAEKLATDVEFKRAFQTKKEKS